MEQPLAAFASMTPVLQEIAASLGSIVRILESLVPSVRVGFVAYKDRDTQGSRMRSLW